MRIRTANGLGLVRLVVALVITVTVMSGSAFGQDKQSGRVVKPKKATGQNVSAQQSGKKGVVSPVLQVPKEADVKVQDYSPGTAYVDADGPEDAPRSSAPAFTMPPDPWNSAGGGSGNAPGGGSSSGSTQPIEPPDENGGCYCVWEQNKVDKGAYVPGCGYVAEYILHELRFRCTFKSGGNPCQNFTSQWDCQHTKKITDMTCLPPPPNAPVTIITTSDCIKCHTND